MVEKWRYSEDRAQYIKSNQAGVTLPEWKTKRIKGGEGRRRENFYKEEEKHSEVQEKHKLSFTPKGHSECANTCERNRR